MFVVCSASGVGIFFVLMIQNITRIKTNIGQEFYSGKISLAI